MSARTKAAIVVRFLMQEGAEIDLAALPTSLQADLTREIADLRLIDRATLAEVIEEFAHELDSIGLTAQGGLGSALRLLEGKITNDTARRLRQDAGVRLLVDPWGRIKQLDEKELLKLLDAEQRKLPQWSCQNWMSPRPPHCLAKCRGPAPAKSALPSHKLRG